MNKIKKINWMVCTCLVFSILFLLSVLPALAQTKKFHLKYGATSVRSGFYANTAVMAGIINKTYPNEIVVTVVETGGYSENLERMRRGTIHAGGSSSGAAAASYTGMLDWQGKPDTNLRSLWGGYFTPIHFMASKKSGITTIDDLAGRIFAMNIGTTSGWHIDYFLKALNIKPDYRMMGQGASQDAMKSGAVESWFKAGFKDAQIMDIETAMDINILKMTPDHFSRAEKVHPGIHQSTTIPAGLFKSVKADQLSYAYAVTDLINRNIPEDVVYKVVKAVWENRAALVANLTTLREGKFDDMVVNATKFGLKVPFHAGAVKYFQEIGQTVPPALIPPEARR